MEQTSQHQTLVGEFPTSAIDQPHVVEQGNHRIKVVPQRTLVFVNARFEFTHLCRPAISFLRCTDSRPKVRVFGNRMDLPSLRASLSPVTDAGLTEFRPLQPSAHFGTKISSMRAVLTGQLDLANYHRRIVEIPGGECAKAPGCGDHT
jgi:hypothetical protein